MAKSVHKGWGSELWYHNDEKYCGKILRFKAGLKCSFHYHMLKHETFVVKSGKFVVVTAKVYEGGGYIDHTSLTLEVMEEGDELEIPPMLAHQMLAVVDSELIEYSTQHFDEDSYRLVKGD